MNSSSEDHSHSDVFDNVSEKISELIDGTISQSDQTELIALMQSDETVRQQYLEMMSLDSMLSWQGSAETPVLQDQNSNFTSPIIDESDEPFSSLSQNRSGKLRQQIQTLRFSLAGLIALCLVLGGALFFRGDSPVASAVETGAEEGEAIAYLTRAENVVWKPTRLSKQTGNLLKSGWLNFESGTVELDFLDGTKMIVEGPAELGLKTQNRMLIRSGSARILSSSKQDFIIETPKHQFKLQTADAGVRIQKEQQEYHLFAGETEMKNKISHEKMKTFVPGEAVQFEEVASENNKSTHVTAIAVNRDQFSDFAKLPQSSSVPAINFNMKNIESYGYQDGQYHLPYQSSVSKQGEQISLQGNCWKMIEVNTDITEDTILEFEFRSDSEGEIHGICFDNDDNYQPSDSENSLFQIYGYEIREGIGQQFNRYQGTEWKRFQIQVGKYLKPGPRKYLIFLADDDVTANAHSAFRNVKLYQAN